MRRSMTPFLVAMTALGLATWSLAEHVRHPSHDSVVTDPMIADTTLATGDPTATGGARGERIQVASREAEAVQGVEERPLTR